MPTVIDVRPTEEDGVLGGAAPHLAQSCPVTVTAATRGRGTKVENCSDRVTSCVEEAFLILFLGERRPHFLKNESAHTFQTTALAPL